MYKSFKEMPIWQEAMNIAEQIHKFTGKLPREELYGLTSQIRKSSLSISANIAEAFGRNHTRDKINFYYFSRGSITETQSHLEYAKRVGYLSNSSGYDLNKKLQSLYNDTNKIIISLRNKKREPEL